MNLTGSLNLNEVQETSNTSLLLSLAVSLAESVIPIVIGATVGHKAMKYWQEKKEKVATKSSVLADYVQSFKRRGALLDGFVKRIFGAYIVFERDAKSQLVTIKDYTDGEFGIQGFLKFPSDANELPSRRFAEEYKELVLETDKTAHVKNRLYSSLGLYYKDGNEATKKLEYIENLLNKAELVVNKFFSSTNGDDFVKLRDNYFALSEKIASETENIGLELTRLRFR